ncbi:MAG TPA: hypothetical protein VFS92_01800 [Planctomycetota bacterium]|nr:hypothetical protein [Planctomycetota bacterium]
MPHRTALLARSIAALAALAPLSGACGSTGTSPDAPAPAAAAGTDPLGPAPSPDDPPKPATGVKAGWISFKPTTKAGQVTTLSLLGDTTEEGKLLQNGKVRVDGGKVVDAKTADNIALAFKEAGFDRFAIKRRPLPAPAGAIAAVWIDRGQGVESLFLMPGARQNPATEELPDVYDALKKLVLSVHMTTPGSVVVTGEGWSGDDMLRQKPGGR